MKKLLIGTALGSAMLLSSVAQAETSVSGYYELNYRALSSSGTSNTNSPNATFGTEMDINLASKNTLSNGMVLDLFIGTTNESGTTSWITDSYGLSLTSGNTTFDISTDRGNTLDMISDVVPNPVDQPADNISPVSATRMANALPAGSTDAVQANTHLTLTQAVGSGKVAVTYLPSDGNGEGNKSSAINTGGDHSGYGIAYYGSVMDGLNVGIGYEKVTGYEHQDAKSTTYGFNYSNGPISFGAQKGSNDTGTGGTGEVAKISVDSLHVGAQYKVSDALTVGVAIQNLDQNTKTSDEEYKQIEAAYSLGALGVGISYTTVENIGGTAGVDDDQLMIRLSSKL
jgi:hypothetical protein